MQKNQKHIFKILSRIIYLFFTKSDECGSLVEKSYDAISGNYDDAWTNHMRYLTESLINKLDPQKNHSSIDLTCGTGFAANLIAQKTMNTVTGVDRSACMLAQARSKYGNNCEFIKSDILEYLKQQPSCSVDIVTCCWGLGYSKPFAVLRQIKRILKPGGKVAIIDNSLFSLREILYCSFLTFAEQPHKLKNLMRFKFLPGSWCLRLFFRLLNLKTLYFEDGSKSYTVTSGQEALEKLQASGAAAGFEYAAAAEDRDEIFNRFVHILEEKYMAEKDITITHRYLAGVAQK